MMKVSSIGFASIATRCSSAMKPNAHTIPLQERKRRCSMNPSITTTDEAIEFLHEHANLVILECPYPWQAFEDASYGKLFFFGSDSQLIAFACKERYSLICSSEPSQQLKGGNT